MGGSEKDKGKGNVHSSLSPRVEILSSSLQSFSNVFDVHNSCDKEMRTSREEVVSKGHQNSCAMWGNHERR